LSNIFSNEDIEYIYKYYNGSNLKEITKKLKRKHVSNICRIARKLGLTDKGRSGFFKGHNKTKKIIWTHKMIEFLKDNYKKMPYRELSKNLHSSEDTIRRKLKELKLVKLEPGESIWDYVDHPRGMKDKTHTKTNRAKISNFQKKYWKTKSKQEIDNRTIKANRTKKINGTINPNRNKRNPYSRAKGGKRPDLGDIYFRSAWEANIARYFNLLGIKWEYEPKEFVFQDVQRGCISYTPDFYLPDEDRWVEVKGWMDKKSITKLNRFKKYFLEEFNKLEIIDEGRYKTIEKNKSLIPGWE